MGEVVKVNFCGRCKAAGPRGRDGIAKWNDMPRREGT